jgi:alkyl hydroperoxide reductase subunit AhpC
MFANVARGALRLAVAKSSSQLSVIPHKPLLQQCIRSFRPTPSVSVARRQGTVVVQPPQSKEEMEEEAGEEEDEEYDPEIGEDEYSDFVDALGRGGRSNEPDPVAAVTQPAPQWQATALVNGEFKKISSEDYKGKWLVLFFYPLDFTFVCPTEIRQFSDRIAEFEALDTAVVAASVDSEYSHLAWTQQDKKSGGLGPMKIPIIADITKRISRDYGVLLEDQGIALRGLFIIDPEGILRQSTINDLPVGRSVDETLRLVQAFQFHAKHGEVCPAGWKPGQEGMKTDASGLKKYFSKEQEVGTGKREYHTMARRSLTSYSLGVQRRDLHMGGDASKHMPPKRKTGAEVAKEAREAYLASAERSRRIFEEEELEAAQGGPKHPDENKGYNKSLGIRVIGSIFMVISLWAIWEKKTEDEQMERKRFQ